MSPIEKQKEFGAGRMQLPKLEWTKLIWNHLDNNVMGSEQHLFMKTDYAGQIWFSWSYKITQQVCG